jgi:hypothetical protein
MKMIAARDGALSPAAANLVGGAQRLLLKSDVALDALEPITPAALAAAIEDPALRRQLVQGMLIVSLADGPPTAEQMDLVDAFAEALAVDGPALRTMRLLADERSVFFRLHFLRHSHLGEVAARGLRERGLLTPIKDLMSLRGYYEDAALAARYRALEDLPEDTLGHAFTRYIHSNGFAYPGDKGGFPEGGIWHDFGHVLSGYGTDPEGELEMVGFQAGYRRENSIYMLLFGAITFSAGVNVTPLAQPDTHGIFARPGLVDRVFRAMDRGANMTTDLFDGWDPWTCVALPIAEARARLGVSAY